MMRDELDQDAVDDGDPSDAIAQIEARLEQLAERAEQCRKIIMFSKVAVAGGALLLLTMMLGLFGSGATAALGSIAAILGGIVSLGSNSSTLQQTTDAIAEAEAHRSELIGRMDLRLVRDGLMKLN